MKQIASLLYICTLVCATPFFFSGCKDEAEDFPKIEVGFDAPSATVHEGDTIVVGLTLKERARKTEYITFSVTSSAAEFGVDYGIDNLFELEDGIFTLRLSADASTASFSLIALEDFENEDQQALRVEIVEVSDGLIPTSGGFFMVDIENVINYKDDNRAMLFDGVDDYIDLGNIYDDLSLPLSISAWVWLDPEAPDGKTIPIFDSHDGLPLYNGFNFLTSKTSVAGVQYGDGLGENHIVYRRAKAATFSPIAGRWVNFTAVVKGPLDMNIYFNGVDVGGEYFGESGHPMNSNSPEEVAKIGAIYQNGLHYKFMGKIDELKIWDKALTEEEVQKTIFKQSSADEAGLIGYWNFDEAAGEAVLDHSSNEFHGVIKGGATRVLSEVPVR